MLVDGLLLFVVLVGWGAQATLPWRLAAASGGWTPAGGGSAAPAAIGRRIWRLAAFPLAVAGLVAAVALADRNPDAAIAAQLVPLLASPPGQLLGALVPALLALSLLLGIAGPRLGDASWRLAAALGLGTCAAAAWAGELLRAGEGPETSRPRLLLLAACRLALTLAGGELLTPGLPLWAGAGGVALLAYLALLPSEVRDILWQERLELTCGAAALLLLAARWLPPRLRRPALAAGLLLAALLLAQAGRVSQSLATGIDYQELPVIR